jgi:hypothetical protein
MKEITAADVKNPGPPILEELRAGEVIDLDESEISLQNNHFTNQYTQELLDDKELNKRLVRKIDLILLPLLARTYVLQYVGKQALSWPSSTYLPMPVSLKISIAGLPAFLLCVPIRRVSVDLSCPENDDGQGGCRLYHMMGKRLTGYCVLQRFYGSRHLSLSVGCIRTSHHTMLYDDHWHVVHEGRAAVSGWDLLQLQWSRLNGRWCPHKCH